MPKQILKVHSTEGLVFRDQTFFLFLVLPIPAADHTEKNFWLYRLAVQNMNRFFRWFIRESSGGNLRLPILRTFQLFPLPIMVQKLPFRNKWESVMIFSVYGTLFVTKTVTPILALFAELFRNSINSSIFNYLISVFSQKVASNPVIVIDQTVYYDYFDVKKKKKNHFQKR